MKRYIIIFFTIGIFLVHGCENFPIGDAFLEKAPGVDVTADTIFSSLEYAERFLWGAYRTLPYGPNTVPAGAKENRMARDWLESLTDINESYLTYGGAFTLYYNGQYNAGTENSNTGTKYHLTQEGNYKGIRMSYIFLQNIDRVKDADPAYIMRLKAEARMIIAIHASDLYRHYGGIPWLTHAYSVNEDFSNILRITARATCDSIISMCDKAAADLPWAIEDLEQWDGRFTKAAAMGLKARMLLFDASPLFNSDAPYLDGEASQTKLTWHGEYNADLWKKAADAAHELITLVESTGDYKLYHKVGNTYRKDFQDAYYQRGTGETLISIRDRFRSPTGSFTPQNYLFYASAGYGCGTVTNDYVEMFPMANGLPINAAGSGYNPGNPYINRDPRLYETVVVNGDTYKGRIAESWIGGRDRLSITSSGWQTGYFLRKFTLDLNTSTSYGSIVHWPYLRLPEIYLSYAEASNEFNNGPDAEAYRCVNIVRSRVGLGNLPAGLTKEQFREAVLTERVCEFGWEEIRWYDLIRWKRESDFTKRLHGINIRRSATAPYTYTYELFETPVRYWMLNWSPKWYLSALPSDEINKGYGLVQNPGWE